MEEECTACADVRFRVPFNLRQHLQMPFHQPERERFQETLQRAFDRHVKLAHADED